MAWHDLWLEMDIVFFFLEKGGVVQKKNELWTNKMDRSEKKKHSFS